MSHYWTAADPVETRQAQIEDWLLDLREFGPEIVQEACGRWRRSSDKRPTIAGIRAFCLEERGNRKPPEHAALEGPSAREAYARSMGFASWLDRQDAIAANELRYRRAEEWRAQQRERGESVSGFTHAATALGVAATEYAPSAEEMAASRRQIGIEE